MNIDWEALAIVYRHMLTSRRMDAVEESLARQGEAFLYVPCAGHEAAAALAPHLGPQDWLHLHYRDKALAMARGVPAVSFFHGLLGTGQSNSLGRRMPSFPSDPALRILSTPTVVGNNALQATGVAAAVKEEPGAPLVLCSLGDGATQQGEVLEAVAEAVRSSLPVLFLIQDNRYALSTPTPGKTFFSLPGKAARSFYGLPIERIDGRDAVAAWSGFRKAVNGLRRNRRPRLLLFEVERLGSHTNADDHTVYRAAEEIERARREADPLPRLAARLREAGRSEAWFRELEKEIDADIQAALAAARAAEPPSVLGGPGVKRPLPPPGTEGEEALAEPGRPALTMLEAMREVLRSRLRDDPRVLLYGEDIEDPKGDVFGLTRGLSSAFPGRVLNSPLSEATIMGMAAGRALAGQRPVALLQFADFLPLAYNQLLSEIGSMYWRTAGAWETPVIVLAICGGYRPGLGPFHAQTPVTQANHVPGLDVLLPSSAADAAGLLNAAFESGRPSLLLYPKNLLNDPRAGCAGPVEQRLVPIGRGKQLRSGNELTLVSWGSVMPWCEKAVDTLTAAGVSVEWIDLRSLFPWDEEMVLASVRKTGRLLVVHEDQLTCGMGAEILARAQETSGRPIGAARVAARDTYLPYHFAAHMAALPGFKDILEAAARLLEYDLAWQHPVQREEDLLVINAIGSSPSDETVTLTEWHVAEGDPVAEGGRLASVEADKAAMEIYAPAAGRVEALLLEVGASTAVGRPLARIRTADRGGHRPAQAAPDPGQPLLTPRRRTAVLPAAAAGPAATGSPVIISSICSTLGSRSMDNETLVRLCPGWSPEDIRRRTGIVRRPWIGEDENVLTLAVSACHKLLEAEGLAMADMNALVCSTGTPLATTPSLACRILKELGPEQGELLMQAHDLNAACSGYLYALQQAWDILQHHPDWNILLVTAETLSPMLDPTDPQTFFLFGDAATASLVSCNSRAGNIRARVARPHLSAMGVDPDILFVPSMNTGEHVRMDGKPVFRVAVHKMIDMLERACAAEGLAVDDLDIIVPHQANERIIEAIRKAIKFPTEKVAYCIRDYGNTSSNTIPLSLAALVPGQSRGARIGLTAFGGGFTFAAGLVELPPDGA